MGKARGSYLRLPEAGVCIDSTWYRHLKEGDQNTLCGVMRNPSCVTRWASAAGGRYSSRTLTNRSRK